MSQGFGVFFDIPTYSNVHGVSRSLPREATGKYSVSHTFFPSSDTSGGFDNVERGRMIGWMVGGFNKMWSASTNER